MMGRQPSFQQKPLHERIRQDHRIRSDHVLRQIPQQIDFNFIYKEFQDTYGANGIVSLPPPVILYNAHPGSELLATIPERLDWLWIIGYDWVNEVPNHSVLPKARARWGTEAFKWFFVRIVSQCLQAGLVVRCKLFMCSCLTQANASHNLALKTESPKRHLNKAYKRLQAWLNEDEQKPEHLGAANQTHISTTYPNTPVKCIGRGESKLKYNVRQALDEPCEVITASEVTAGSVHEAHRMDSLLDAHAHNTGVAADVCVADSKFDTIKSYLNCHDPGVNTHFASLKIGQLGTGRHAGILPRKSFSYDATTDIFICPAGERLTRRRFSSQRQQWGYTSPSKSCGRCALQPQCTRSKAGISLKRHKRHAELVLMLYQTDGARARCDRKRRQHQMERSFARGTRYGIKQGVNAG